MNNRLLLALLARIDPSAQVGIIQFADNARLESRLSQDRNSVEKAVEGMYIVFVQSSLSHTQSGMYQIIGGTNLFSGLSVANSEFGLSRYRYAHKLLVKLSLY